MSCNCISLGSVRGNDTIILGNELDTLAVDAFLWKTLYKCSICKAFWEESYTGGRWGGEPILSKVDSDYVRKEWGEKYL